MKISLSKIRYCFDDDGDDDDDDDDDNDDGPSCTDIFTNSQCDIIILITEEEHCTFTQFVHQQMHIY